MRGFTGSWIVCPSGLPPHLNKALLSVQTPIRWSLGEREARDEEKSHIAMASRENSPWAIFSTPLLVLFTCLLHTNVSESEDGLWSGKHFLALRGAVFQLQEFALSDFSGLQACVCKLNHPFPVTYTFLVDPLTQQIAVWC